MSNIGKHLQDINKLNNDNYNYHYIDVQNEINRLSKTKGAESELGAYVAKASRIVNRLEKLLKIYLNPKEIQTIQIIVRIILNQLICHVILM